MKPRLLSPESIQTRQYWIREIAKISGNFGQDAARVDRELTQEIRKGGLSSLLNHLRLCGAVPECYDHDSSEEKLYSKYTDTLLAVAFRHIGLAALVLTDRADAADVEAIGKADQLCRGRQGLPFEPHREKSKGFQDSSNGWVEAGEGARNRGVPSVSTAISHQPNLSAGGSPKRVHTFLLTSWCSGVIWQKCGERKSSRTTSRNVSSCGSANTHERCKCLLARVKPDDARFPLHR